MNNSLRVVLLLALCLLSYASDSGKPYRAKGVASWYGEESGDYTANGERFRPHKLTAASWTLPFNTKVRITNLKNGKSVIVRVNDRGPAHRLHRLIDLSEGAAKEIGMNHEGLAKVLVEEVK